LNIDIEIIEEQSMTRSPTQSAALALLLVAAMSAVTACQNGVVRGASSTVSVASTLPVFA
jgi:hypothetical protein